MLKRLLIMLSLSASLFLVACDGGGDDAPAATTPANTQANTEDEGDDEEASGSVSLAGNWYYKHEVMKLSQSGTKVEGVTIANGFKQDPADPIVYPVPTVGSIDASGAVKLSELIRYTSNPAKNYNIDKVATFKGGNTLVLKVIKGQKSPDQTWTRK